MGSRPYPDDRTPDPPHHDRPVLPGDAPSGTSAPERPADPVSASARGGRARHAEKAPWPSGAGRCANPGDEGPGIFDPVTRLSLDALAEAVSTPPPGARARLLSAARSARRPASAATFAAPYAARVAAMDALLASATPADWSQKIVEGWTLQELVAHLAATDGLVAAAIGVPVAGPPPTTGDIPGRTAEMIARTCGRPPERTRAEWRTQAGAICEHAATMAPATSIAPGGIRFPVSDHLLIRMLETWIHTIDAATVIGRSLPLPLAAHIHPIADFCARLIPRTMLFSGVDGGTRALRLTLTGPGGGTWHVPLDAGATSVPDDGSPSDAQITCDAVRFCFLLGGRGAPETFAATIGGDAGLAREVLRCAPAMSGP